MSEGKEISSAPISPRRPVTIMPKTPISCPPSQLHSPSFSRSPLLSRLPGESPPPKNKTPRTPRISLTPRFITPLASPIRKALNLTKFDPQDAWLPITASRNGNKYYAGFHTLCSGIGVQALVLPVAFTALGWTWGIISLTLGFIWQLYTLWLLVQLHESSETGMRYNRYMQLYGAAFDTKIGKFLAKFSIMYLSGGTCMAMIIIGGSTLKLFLTMTCHMKHPLTAVECYLVFTTMAVVLSQLPNLNSIAGVSLIGAITAIGYCTLIWVVSVVKGQVPRVSYDPLKVNSSDIGEVFGVLTALGIIAFAFRGHNLILEIQATMPSSEKHPSHVPMWKGVMAAYTLIAMCLFPLAIGGYWAYGNQIPPAQGILKALYMFRSKDVSRFLIGLTSFCVIVSALTSFQIYGMPTFDDIESFYTSRKNKPCPWWLRSLSRALFGYICFFSAVAMPMTGGVAGLIGGVTLPVTMAYPCFMWVKIRKPRKFSSMWWLNWGLGILGMGLSSLLVAAAVYVMIETGVKVNFFKPQ